MEANELSIDAQTLLQAPDLWATIVFGHEVPPEHSWLWQYLVDETIRYLVILWPGGGAKSTLVTQEHTIYDLCRNRNHRTCLIQKSHAQAMSEMSAIMRQLTHNRTLTDLYGDFKPPGEDSGFPWSTSALRVIGNTNSTEKTHNVHGYGVGSTDVLGGRYDTVKPDDVCTEDNSNTPEAREKLETKLTTEWDKTLIGAAVPRLIMDGTAFKYDDLYLSKINSNACTAYIGPSDWRTPDELTAEDKSGYVVIHKDVEVGIRGKPFWPKQFPQEFLEFEKRKNLINYNRRLRNIVRTSDQVVFPEPALRGGVDEWGNQYPGCLERDMVLGEREGSWKIICGADPSSGKKTGASAQFAHAVIGVDGDDIHVVDLFTAPIPMTRNNDGGGENDGKSQIGTIVARHLRYGATFTVIEDNAQQHAWITTTREVAPLVKVKPHNTNKNKVSPEIGVESMAALMEAGRLHIPYGNKYSVEQAEKLIEQLVYYPDYSYSDLVMALWFCVFYARKRSKVKMLSWEDLRKNAREWKKVSA